MNLIIIAVYVAFLAAYLPLNFYMVYRVHEMRLSDDKTSLAMSFLVGGIGVFMLISLLTIIFSNL